MRSPTPLGFSRAATPEDGSRDKSSPFSDDDEPKLRLVDWCSSEATL
jgi:hypothetical protein